MIKQKYIYSSSFLLILTICLLSNARIEAQKRRPSQNARQQKIALDLSQYVNSRFGYSFKIPPPLTIDDVSTLLDKHNMFIRPANISDEKSPAEIFILANDAFLEFSLEGFVKGRKESLSSIDTFNLQKEERIKVGDIPAVSLTFETKDVFERVNVWQTIYVYRAAAGSYPGATYDITLRTTPDKLQKDAELFDKIISSLKFDNFLKSQDTTDVKPKTLATQNKNKRNAELATLINRVVRNEQYEKYFDDLMEQLNLSARQ